MLLVVRDLLFILLFFYFFESLRILTKLSWLINTTLLTLYNLVATKVIKLLRVTTCVLEALKHGVLVEFAAKLEERRFL